VAGAATGFAVPVPSCRAILVHECKCEHNTQVRRHSTCLYCRKGQPPPPPRERAIERRVFLLSAIVLLSFVGDSSFAPAFARGGASGVGTSRLPSASSVHAPLGYRRSHVATARVINRRIGGQSGLGRRNLAEFQNGWPIVGWPYWQSIDGTPMDAPPLGSEVSPSPSVTVISGPPERIVGAPPDYSYAAGCHAIPGGYHCDVPRNAGAVP
jgi:hypothetical protein